jgi:acetolactate synthase-1/2/3 large subunit
MSKGVKLSDFVLDFLIRHGVKHIFNLAGGYIAHFLDSLYLNKKIHSVAVHHEQAGAFAAEGYARMTANLGTAMATSGPGATNMLTGIASAFFDSVPVLYITGQVNTYEYRYSSRMRQRGFQETAIVDIVKPVTKYAVRITDPTEIRYALEKAVYLAVGGRPGPVLIDIPMDVQRAVVEIEALRSFFDSAEYGGQAGPEKAGGPVKAGGRTVAAGAGGRISAGAHAEIDLLLKRLAAAQRPLLLVGGGIRSSGAYDLFRKLFKQLRLPVVSSLLGLDVVPHTDDLYAGMIGSYGVRSANLSAANCDFLLVLGSRLDTRQTGTKPETFARQAHIFHVDIDRQELAHRLFNHYHPIQMDLKVFFNLLAGEISAPHAAPWRERIRNYKQKYARENYGDQMLDLYDFFLCLSRGCGGHTVFTLDVGQHQMWAAQMLELRDGHRLLTCGGLGAMGFGLPAAVGAYFADKGALHVLITGDGSFQLNMQELETVRHYNIPLKMFIMNNSSLGMVREFQEIYFNKRYQSTVKDYSCVDFGKLARAFDITYGKIERNREFEAQAGQIIGNPGPVITEVVLPRDTHVYPKLLVGNPLENQSPFLDPGELLDDMPIDRPRKK